MEGDYVSGYTPRELDAWAAKVAAWLRGPKPRDVYVYFDNDTRARAPLDARGLMERVRGTANYSSRRITTRVASSSHGRPWP